MLPLFIHPNDVWNLSAVILSIENKMSWLLLKNPNAAHEHTVAFNKIIHFESLTVK